MSNTISPEDMASFEVLHTQNHTNDSFPSEEYSFLPEVSSAAVPNGDINNFHLANMQSALATAMHDSSVEVHSQLLELIEENNSLKEKLNKNNLMMKEQMSTISEWRNHMMLSKDQQQCSLQKAMEKISALERENNELHEKIDNMVKTTVKEKVQPCTKCTIFENALNKYLAIDSVEDGESMLLGLSDFREYLLPNLIVICKHVEAISDTGMNAEERHLMKIFVLLLKFKIAALEAGDLRASVQTDEESGYEVVHQKIHESITQLHQDMEDLQKVVKFKDNELELLRKEKEKLLETIKSYELKLQESEAASKSRFELLSNKLEIETSVAEKYRERCENLQKQIEEYEVKLDKTKVSDDNLVKELREEVKTLQDILKMEQSANQEAKGKLSEVMLKCENLQVDYVRVSKLLAIQSKDLKEKSEELTNSKESATMEYLEKVDQLTAQLFEMEEQLRVSQAEVRNLQDKLANVTDEKESIPILHEQIKLYKTDFENMLTAKNAAVDEMERLTNELKKCERKCDSCPCSCSNKSQTSGSRGHRSGRMSDMEQSTDIQCPFCQDTFKNERAAHHHINRVHDDDQQQN